MKASSTTACVIAACLACCAACASTTAVNESWSNGARPRAPLGKTLVVALLRDPRVAAQLEQEWARQLRSRGVEATPLDALSPSVRPPGRHAVEQLVQQHGFATVLVSKLLDIKRVERDVPTSQVAVVETKLYDARTSQPFWSAETDTFLAGASSEEERRPGGRLVRAFVETLMAELDKAQLF
ncbi:MAG TPA: hypothetical protein VJR89_15755 [Polyangiales bacterium]|nr:hypothetical protein [Polyangiales bacterium]